MTAPSLAMVTLDPCTPPSAWDAMLRRTVRPGQSWVCPHGYAHVLTWQTTVAGIKLAPVWVCVGPIGTDTLPAQVAALAAAVAELQARTVQPRQAQAPVLAIAVGGKLDVTATWDTAYPDTNYRYDVLIPSALVGKVTVAEKTKTATAVTLTLTASQLVVTGSVLNLIGARWA